MISGRRSCRRSMFLPSLANGLLQPTRTRAAQGRVMLELRLLAAALRRRSRRGWTHHQRRLAAAGDCRRDAARIQDGRITTSICWCRWPSIRSSSRWPALPIAASRGSGRALRFRRPNADVARLLNVWMDSWTNGPGTDPHFYLSWKITPAFQPLKDAVVGSIGNVLWVVMATIGVVMLIACTNVANLLLVRADARQQELAVRAALGAGTMAHCARAAAGERDARPAGRSSRRGSCLCRTAPVDGDWAGRICRA